MYGEKYGQAGRDGLDAGKVAAPRTHRGAINLPGDPANSGKRLHGALSCVSLLNYITVALVASLWALRLAQSRPELRVTPESGAATAFALIAAVSGMSGAAHLMGATRSRGSPTSTSLIAFAMATNGFAVAFLFFGQMATWNLMAPDPSERGWSVAAVISLVKFGHYLCTDRVGKNSCRNAKKSSGQSPWPEGTCVSRHAQAASMAKRPGKPRQLLMYGLFYLVMVIAHKRN